MSGSDALLGVRERGERERERGGSLADVLKHSPTRGGGRLSFHSLRPISQLRLSLLRFWFWSSVWSSVPGLNLRSISLLRFSLLRFVDSKFQANSLWAWEFNPLQLRWWLSQPSSEIRNLIMEIGRSLLPRFDFQTFASCCVAKLLAKQSRAVR